MAEYNGMDANEVLKKLERHPSLTDTMIQIEDFLDSLHIYAFENWFDGEVVDGPHVKRYWVSITLKWPYEEMPDPDGALRLIKHNAKVQYYKEKEMVPVEIESPSDFEGVSKRPKQEPCWYWYVDITVPRRFIEDTEEDLDLYDDEVDIDDVEDAIAKGMDSEETYKQNNIDKEEEQEKEQEDEEEDEEKT